MIAVQLPSLGEGIMSGVIVSVLVTEGEYIEENQSILEIETDKVTMEVPSSASGIVSKILAKEGEELNVGEPMIELESNDNSEVESAEDEIIETETQVKMSSDKTDSEISGVSPVLIKERGWAQTVIRNSERSGLRSTPRARKLARQLNVDTNEIYSRSDVIIKEDVIAHVHLKSQSKEKSVTRSSVPDFSKWGSIRQEKMSGIMKATAANMEKSWREIPHAWLTDTADITSLELERKGINQDHGLSISTTIFIVKAIANALEKLPIFNASLDMQSQQVIYKDYINIGVAVDSPDGLYVPVLKDANKKTLSYLSAELIALSEKAATKKLTLTDLEGGNFSISNLGAIGTNSIFPLVVPNQVAILGVARYQLSENKKQLPLTIGFDHRIINGADAARFLKFVISLLENPIKILV